MAAMNGNKELVLAVLSAASDPMTCVEVAEACGITMQQAASAITDARNGGLVEYANDFRPRTYRVASREGGEQAAPVAAPAKASGEKFPEAITEAPATRPNQRRQVVKAKAERVPPMPREAPAAVNGFAVRIKSCLLEAEDDLRAYVERMGEPGLSRRWNAYVGLRYALAAAEGRG